MARIIISLCLVANAIGTFCLALEHGDLSNYSVINMGTYDTPNDHIFINRIEEVPLYILMGLGGGILGGVFCERAIGPVCRQARVHWTLAYSWMTFRTMAPNVRKLLWTYFSFFGKTSDKISPCDRTKATVRLPHFLGRR